MRLEPTSTPRIHTPRTRSTRVGRYPARRRTAHASQSRDDRHVHGERRLGKRRRGDVRSDGDTAARVHGRHRPPRKRRHKDGSGHHRRHDHVLPGRLIRLRQLRRLTQRFANRAVVQGQFDLYEQFPCSPTATRWTRTVTPLGATFGGPQAHLGIYGTACFMRCFSFTREREIAPREVVRNREPR